MERWEPVRGYVGIYEVSDDGRVRSLDRTAQGKDGRLMKFRGAQLTQILNSDGYLQVQLNRAGVRKTVKIHRLVAEAFIPNPLNLPEVNHKDESKINNAASNLEWCTHQYNSSYGTRGRRIALNGVRRQVDAYQDGDSETLHFESMAAAARHFNVAGESIRQAIKYGWKCKGYNIVESEEVNI